LQIIYSACIIPGTNPIIVKIMLIIKSIPIPLSKKTPSGGKMIAKIILKISEQVNGILFNMLF